MSDTLIYGFNAVRSAVERDAESLERIWVDRSRRDERMRRLVASINAHGVVMERVSRADLDQRCPGVRHQGVVAQCNSVMPLSDKSLWQLLDRLQSPPFLLVLDGVQDPHNLGACLRSAAAAGVDAVIAPRDRAVGMTPVVRKVASGGADVVPFVQVTNLARVLHELQSRGVWTVGASGDTDNSIYDADLRGPLALILGSEGKGLRRLTREHCDLLVAIPMTDRVESLNVSVAAGVCLFEAARQRRD